jgi:hypothetical protein
MSTRQLLGFRAGKSLTTLSYVHLNFLKLELFGG